MNSRTPFTETEALLMSLDNDSMESLQAYLSEHFNRTELRNLRVACGRLVVAADLVAPSLPRYTA